MSSSAERALRRSACNVIAATLAAAAAAVPPALAAARDREARPATTDATAIYRLRCWQWGRLIVDETGVPLPGEQRAEAELFRFARGPGQAPSTLIVRAGTTCLATPAPARPLTPHSW